MLNSFDKYMLALLAVFLLAGLWVKHWMDGNMEKAGQERQAEAQAAQAKAQAIEQINQGPPSPWRPLSGNIWSGVKTYYGPGHRYVGEILGGNSDYVDPMTGQKIRGVKIRYPSGSEEWKDRDAIIQDARWQVNANDPALDAMLWHEFQF